MEDNEKTHIHSKSENVVHENPHSTVEHVGGKINPADMFSKEYKDISHH